MQGMSQVEKASRCDDYSFVQLSQVLSQDTEEMQFLVAFRISCVVILLCRIGGVFNNGMNTVIARK